MSGFLRYRWMQNIRYFQGFGSRGEAAEPQPEQAAGSSPVCRDSRSWERASPHPCEAFLAAYPAETSSPRAEWFVALGSLLLQDICVSWQMACCTTCSLSKKKIRCQAGSSSVSGSPVLRFQYYLTFFNFKLGRCEEEQNIFVCRRFVRF